MSTSSCPGNAKIDGAVYPVQFQLAHVLMEVRRYTQTPYMIELRQEVVDYLLDPSRLLTDDQTYEASLRIEPRRTLGGIAPTKHDTDMQEAATEADIACTDEHL